MDKIIQIGNIVSKSNFKNPNRGRIYSIEGIAPSCNGMGGGGNLETKILLTYD